jgi:hypothetical protein
VKHIYMAMMLTGFRDAPTVTTSRLAPHLANEEWAKILYERTANMD